ncbi:MAG: signal peptide peptidase SppA [Candidatus Cryptobacteroides sp.]
MKNFLKMTLAAMLGFLIVSILLSLFTMSLIGSLASLGKTAPVMPREAVLKIDFSELTITEQTCEADPMAMLQSGNFEKQKVNLGIWTAVQAINKAAEDPAIKFIYLKPDEVQGGLTGIEEIRKSLLKFRTRGKAVISFIESPGNASYYLASASDKIFMSSYKGGMNMLNGLSSQMMFLKDILDKAGINMQLIRHGKYKSAGEMYTKSSASKENLEQNQVMVNSLWDNWAAGIAETRSIGKDELNRLIDGLGLNSPEDFKENGLVDELVTNEEFDTRFSELYGADRIEDCHSISLADYATLKVLPKYKAKNKIAIIYAEGSIVDGDSEEEVSGKNFADIIASVRKDSTVKAVVFRVNSPGGSVFASDMIKNEIDILKENKPVIASYGDYAASGGYWISNNCDKIFSNAGTLTGSIGVFSLIPDFSGTAKKVGVNFTSVKSNRHSDIYGGMRALDSAETEYMQASVDDIYETFTAIVARGRDLEQDYVDGIAQGRVWAGSDALRIGLVDSIGGIEDAVDYAMAATGESTNLSDWMIAEYPKPLTTAEKLMKLFSGTSSNAFAGTPLESVVNTFSDIRDANSGKVYAMMPYYMEIR